MNLYISISIRWREEATTYLHNGTTMSENIHAGCKINSQFERYLAIKVRDIGSWARSSAPSKERRCAPVDGDVGSLLHGAGGVQLTARLR